MKSWILADEHNIVRCMASDVKNLHASKIEAGMLPELVECGGTVGDEYKDGVWTARPDNYPQPSEEQMVQQQIALAKRIVSLKAARFELTGEAALACQLEVERLSQELENACSG